MPFRTVFKLHLKHLGDDYDNWPISPLDAASKVPVRRLPPELERDIFELTMQIHRESAFRLVLVAKRVQIWIEQILYRTVNLEDMRTIDLFLRTLHSRPSSFFSRYIKNLSITNYRDPSKNNGILRICSGTEVLADWVPTGASRAWLLKRTPVRPLRRLSIHLWSLTVSENVRHPSRDIFGEPFFHYLTHLDVLDVEGWDRFSGFDLIPQLTHLSFQVSATSLSLAAKILTILSTCNRLEILALFFNPFGYTRGARQSTIQAACAHIKDPRLVILTGPTDKAKDWEAAVRGEHSIWTTAEGLINKTPV